MPKCQYCGEEPYKTYCKGYHKHVEICRLQNEKPMNVTYVINNTYNVANIGSINIHALGEPQTVQGFELLQKELQKVPLEYIDQRYETFIDQLQDIGNGFLSKVIFDGNKNQKIIFTKFMQSFIEHLKTKGPLGKDVAGDLEDFVEECNSTGASHLQICG